MSANERRRKQREAGPHQGGRLLTRGRPIGDGVPTVILLHGRGGTPESMMALAEELRVPGATWLAPEARGNTWYPHSFLAPLERNEPALSSALRRIDDLLQDLADHGVTADRVAILGFSQGGCLALEFAARTPRRYGGLVGLSAGLIGPGGTPRPYVESRAEAAAGGLEGTPVFLGCSDADPHIPLWRLEETVDVLERMGAVVEKRIYPGMGHTVNRDEIGYVRSLLASLADA